MLLAAFFCGNAKKMKRILLYTLIVLYFFSNSFIVDEFMRSWEIRSNYKETRTKKYEYGIVLGGIMSGYLYKTEQIVFNRSVDRLMQALVLYEQGIIKKIVYTGGSGSIIERDMKEAKFVYNFLLSMGIPDSCMIIESESRNTYENAIYTKKIIGSDSNRCDLLITSGCHMRRSLGIFRKHGFCVDPYSADLNAGKRKYDPAHLFVPSFRAMEEWGQMIHEWVGIISYKIKGYM